MARIDGRRPDELRPVRITPHYLDHAEGSALIEVGKTSSVLFCGRIETCGSLVSRWKGNTLRFQRALKTSRSPGRRDVPPEI